MRIVVAGGSGFLGRSLVERLLADGHEVAVLSRDRSKVKAGRGVDWDGRSPGPWTSEIEAADAVVNLAGESIGDGRWSDERRQRLIASRLDATRAIVEALQQAPPRRRVLVNASAVGLYGSDRGNEVLSETSARGTGFLADLVERWESEARKAEAVARVVLLRFGVILAEEGGALRKMLLPFRMGVGGPVAGGRQWMSWIDRDDATRMIAWAMENENARGPYNATAPHPVTNRQFSHELGRALHRLALLPTPAFALRLMFGEMADELLIGGQRVVPVRAEAEGFTFQAGRLEASLSRQLDSR